MNKKQQSIKKVGAGLEPSAKIHYSIVASSYKIRFSVTSSLSLTINYLKMVIIYISVFY